MSSNPTECPRQQVLSDFGLGRLEHGAVETVYRHLETCADCFEIVASLPNDSFVDRMLDAQRASKARRSEESVSNADPPSKTPGGAEWRFEPDGSAGIAGGPLIVPPELAAHSDYEVLKELGHGGMGIVYLARNRLMDRLEVLKVLNQSLVRSSASLERFQQEIRSAARLHHPNIVTAHSVLRLGDLLVFVMEYVAGEDLACVVKQRGPLPVTSAAYYAQQVAWGLQHAHEKGMVHRDVKPNNVILAIDNKRHLVKILDFGLAKATSEKHVDGSLTQSGQILGTPHYIAPEQALDSGKADIRADIYSLGCTLYFFLTGTPPFQRPGLLDLLSAHQHAEAVALSELREDVPAELNAIVTKMMAKAPGDRYQTPGDVAQALTPFCTITGHSESAVLRADVLPVRSPPDGEGDSRPLGAGMGPIARSDLPREEELSNAVSNEARTVRQGASGEPERPSKASIVAAGLWGLFVAVLGVIVIFRDPQGNQIARVEVPQAATLEVRQTGPPAAPGTQRDERAENPPAREPTTSPFPNSADGNAKVNLEDVKAASPAPALAAANLTHGTMPPLAIAPFDARQTRSHQEAWAKYLGVPVETTNSIDIKMVLIPPGEFLMGSTPDEVAKGSLITVAFDGMIENNWLTWRQQEEQPQHSVILTRPHYAGMTEVTVDQFASFVRATGYQTEAELMRQPSWLAPGHESSGKLPVTQITWTDAVRFCNWLSEKEKSKPCYRLDGNTWTLLPAAAGNGSTAARPTQPADDSAAGVAPGRESFGYRLPTEAEREFECRAGTTTQFWFGDSPDDLAKHEWYGANSEGHPHAVGTKSPNPFGLYDMHGNVLEWCSDKHARRFYPESPLFDPLGCPTGDARVLRGGAWSKGAGYARSAFRLFDSLTNHFDHAGFRVVRVLDASVPLPSPATQGQRGDPSSQAAVIRTNLVPDKLRYDGKSFEVLVPEGGQLVGFDVSIGPWKLPGFGGYRVIQSLRPIFRAAESLVEGSWQGAAPENVERVIAKPGFKVGGLTLFAGFTLDAIQVRFVPVEANDPQAGQPYTSERIGGPEGAGGVELNRDNLPVVGVVGTQVFSQLRLGLLLRHP